MIKVYALKTWLAVRNFYNKQKYNLFVYKEENKFLQRWKKFSPETFNLSKTITPLNPVTADLIEASKKEVPEADIDPTKQLIDEVFPHGGKSNDLVVGPDNPNRVGLISDKTLDEIFPPEQTNGFGGH
jgi:hypothetical protein